MENREYESIVDRVRRFRREMTPYERIMWLILKNRGLMGYKFRRQHPIVVELDDSRHKTYFILDFYCPELMLGIEVDGSVHRNQQEYDNHRDYQLSNYGINIVRFQNDELAEPMQVKQKLEDIIWNMSQGKPIQ